LRFNSCNLRTCPGKMKIVQFFVLMKIAGDISESGKLLSAYTPLKEGECSTLCLAFGYRGLW